MAGSEDAFSIFVGIDWGSEAHQVCVMDGSRKVLLEKAFAHSGKGLGELVDAVLQEAAGHAERVAVAIEVPRGAIVDTLLEKDIAVFAINPKQLDRFRDRHSHGRALRGIADRLLATLVALLKTKTPYDPTRRGVPSPAGLPLAVATPE